MFLIKKDIDILCINESKLNKEEGNAHLVFDGYNCFHLPRKVNPSAGGGVCMFLKNSLIYNEINLSSFHENKVEVIGIELELADKKLAVFSYYSPYAVSETFFYFLN
jgi:exonuclease III